jgi:hypothetical protein
MTSSIDSVLSAYMELTEAFVKWDSTGAIAAANKTNMRLAGLKLLDLKDSLDTDLKAGKIVKLAQKDLQDISTHKDITSQRRGFNTLTANLYSFLETARYEGQPVYRNQCPMAFNDTEPADWLSRSEDIRNPYLGLHHPRYGKSMLSCGENKAKIEFPTAHN